MRRLPVTFRSEARTDLADIYRTIFAISRDAATARRFVQRFKDRCDRIGDAPRGGRPRDDLEPGLRTMPLERSVVIAYRVEADRVRVTDAFYGGRDFEALYADGWPDDGSTPAR